MHFKEQPTTKMTITDLKQYQMQEVQDLGAEVVGIDKIRRIVIVYSAATTSAKHLPRKRCTRNGDPIASIPIQAHPGRRSRAH